MVSQFMIGFVSIVRNGNGSGMNTKCLLCKKEIDFPLYCNECDCLYCIECYQPHLDDFLPLPYPKYEKGKIEMKDLR